MSNERSTRIIIKPKYKKSIGITIAIAIAALLSFSAISRAFADNVVNDVAATGANTVAAGSSTIINYRIVANNGDNQDGCNAGPDGSPAIVTINKPAAVTVSPDPIPFSACGVPRPVSFSSNTPGDYLITASVSDSGVGTYNTNPATFTLHVTGSLDTTAPTVNVPAPITAEATGPGGAAVSYTATAIDNVDGSITPTCSPASGSTFPITTTQVTCTATDRAGNTGSNSFTVTVQDTTRPVVSVPAGITTEANVLHGATVSFTSTATDTVDSSVAVTCNPASGSTFPIGITQVTCSATDHAGNTGSNSFSVTVQDTTPPALSLPSQPITAEATGASGATVSYTASASDIADGDVAIQCAPASGSPFALGTTQVTCSARDAAGNTANGGFSVIVVDTTPPALSLPTPITAEATGASGATVSYTASATDLVDGNVAIQCAPASGSTFAIAATTVTCSARDAAGNTANGGFSITVQDTTAPNLSGIPQNIANVHITSDAGAIVSYASATATDIVDGSVNVVCDPASGSLFAIGTKQVTCSATDAHSNTATGTFSVQVIAPTVGFQFLQPVNDPAGDSVVKIGSTLPVKFTMRFADDGSSYGGCTNCKISLNGPSGTTTLSVDEAILTTPADSGVLFRYDPTGQQYIYNMGSKTLKEGKYTLTASFDGIAPNHSVQVAYRK